LTNLEPLKCEDWKWVSWKDIIAIKKNTPEVLFDPIRHLLDDLPEETFVK
jgi:hypothetical protein